MGFANYAEVWLLNRLLNVIQLTGIVINQAAVKYIWGTVGEVSSR
jgi:hypothetical protein